MAGSNSCYSCISQIPKFHYMMVLPLQMYSSQPRCMASYLLHVNERPCFFKQIVCVDKCYSFMLA